MMNKLTVIIRDDAPMIFACDSPSYRSVSLELTEQQKEKIKLKVVGNSGGKDIYESVSQCFLEQE